MQCVCDKYFFNYMAFLLFRTSKSFNISNITKESGDFFRL